MAYRSNNSIPGNFTFTTATSGVSETLTVSNTSNTSSSAAYIVANVAGGTADDAVHQSTITAGQAWSFGLDNSDSDAFVIASSATLGTTNVMRTQTTGEINFPLQTSFLVTANLQSSVTGDGTIYTTAWANEIFDQNSDFASDTFTAPVTGRYIQNIMHRISGVTTTSWNLWSFTLATSNRSYATTLNPGAVKDGNNNCSQAFSQICDFDAADTATVTVQVSGSTKSISVAAATLTQWSGQLLA